MLQPEPQPPDMACAQNAWKADPAVLDFELGASSVEPPRETTFNPTDYTESYFEAPVIQEIRAEKQRRRLAAQRARAIRRRIEQREAVERAWEAWEHGRSQVVDDF